MHPLTHYAPRGFSTHATNTFFDDLFIRSIALNTLITQQRYALAAKARTGEKVPPRSGGSFPHVDCISLNIPLSRAIADASALCLEKNGEAPSVKLRGDAGRSIVCVEAHLYFVSLELLKNALKATVDRHRSATALPDVEVTADAAGGDLRLTVRDQGTGLSAGEADEAFDWFHSSEPPKEPTYTYSGTHMVSVLWTCVRNIQWCTLESCTTCHNHRH